MIDIEHLNPSKPVLIYGPTASGKSSLALEIAKQQGGEIVNADALQIYAGWPILTAQPSADEQANAPHHLYGVLNPKTPFSVGEWLSRVAPLLFDRRPIIVGGTGLYFTALTQGLAEIPPTPAAIRNEGDKTSIAHMISELDAVTKSQIDLNNRARVQRAWEVWKTTGRSISDWQQNTPPPLLPLEKAEALVLMPDRDWLNARIEARFDVMLRQGLLEEARAMRPKWSPEAPGSKAIGAAEMIAWSRGEMDLETAKARIVIASRQYAKRQRTWARSRMKSWKMLHLPPHT